MFKLLFLIILFIILEMSYAPSIINLNPLMGNFLQSGSFNFWPWSLSSSTVGAKSPDVTENPVKIPQKNPTQGLSEFAHEPSTVLGLNLAGSDSETTSPEMNSFCPKESDKENSCILPTFRRLCIIKSRPVIELSMSDREVDGKQGDIEKYAVNSQVCFKNDPEEVKVQEDKAEVYFFWFDHKRKETIYAEFYLLGPQLSFEGNSKEGGEISDKMNTDGYGYFGDFFETVKNSYTKSKTAYKAKKLVSPDDLAQGAYKITTFHFANVKPLHEDLFQIWDKIGELILNSRAAKEMRPHLFRVGAFRITKGDENVKYVYENNIEIPELWIKLVIVLFEKNKFESVHKGLAILMNNVSKDTILKKDDKLCEQNFCDIPNRKVEVFGELADAGRNVRCCPITESILAFFNLDTGFSDELKDIGNLMIDNLTESQPIAKSKEE